MTKELAGLTLEAVDALIVSINRREGLIADGDFHNKNGSCAIGSLGYDSQGRYDIMRRVNTAHDLGLRKYGWPPKPEIYISDKSEIFEGTPEERKQHMIGWLHEQRALKCCDWVPAPKEIVPARRNATVDAG